MALDSATIVAAFKSGRGVEFPLSDPKEIHEQLRIIGHYLDTLATENSFSWPSFNKLSAHPTRKSVWVLNRSNGEQVVSSEEISKTDGDMSAGSRGLDALKNPEVREAFTFLYQRSADCLKATATAIGLPPEVQALCSIRTRLISYDGSERSGIGAHFDGNTITAVISDGPGLTEIALDGEVYPVDYNKVSVMAGTALYRASKTQEEPFIPALHTVKAAKKTTMAMFFNLPDKTEIPPEWLGTGFYHDVGAMKAQDGPGPDEPLRNLWEAVAVAHKVTPEDLAAGNIPKLKNI